MVVGKKRSMGYDSLHPQTSSGSFENSSIYQIITLYPVEKVAAAMREAVFSNYENVHMVCPDTGMTYLHLIADNYEKFCDSRALPVVYMLCYVGIDVSAQDKEESETALHRLMRKPGAYKIVVALLRYGIDVSITNRHGLTAEQYLEAEHPPGYKEIMHWYKKFCPGLQGLITRSDGGHKSVLDSIEKLLKGWCKVNIFAKGKPLNLLQTSQMRAKDALLAEMLKKYYWTNEFVHATLAGLPEEMKRIYKESKKRVDVDTLDHSYQLSLDSELVPQPLVAAAWEQSNYDVIDQLLLLDADVCNSYSNQPEINPAKPLFYQTILGTPRVTDVNVLLRILQDGDLRCKTEHSTTFLHESVKYNLPAQFVAKLLTLDVPIEERDRNALTARELALKNNRHELVQVMDDFVIEAAKQGDVKRLEHWVLQMYDVNDVKAGDGRTLAMLAESKELPSKVVKFLQTIPEMQSQMLSLWNCMYRNDLVQLKKFLNNKDLKKVIYSRNRCGRSILLIAILNKNKEAVRLIAKKHPKLVEYFDNNMLTCLHYAFIIFDEDKEPAQWLQAAGASVDWCCTKGMSAYFYQKHIISEEMYQFVFNFLMSGALSVLPDSEVFQQRFTQACMNGNLAEVRQLTEYLVPYGSISSLGNSILFDVIDAKLEDVALFLIECGCDATLTKQYEICSPANELCAMMECFHPRSTLAQRAKVNNLARLFNFLNKELTEMHSVPSPEQQGLINMEVDPETGVSPGSNSHMHMDEETGLPIDTLTTQFSENTRL
ncbi:hypothetical protein EB796_017286 [Bugula neritina]|uniref:Uncharacterized protein n=1 Tax=Bugula neritina TaxID=10212 RepID=A0A7J7JFH0_BUGNE|nr:hypothetical protein EB796_017286 [Bugula neritina]